MRCVVTGAAGFIGSHLCEELLRRGHIVVGVDAFTPFYSPHIKAHNQAVALSHPHYQFHAADLRRDDLSSVVEGADAIFHLAAMPGLPRSWVDFDGYWTCNVQATQRLLEAVRNSPDPLRRFIQVSTSSVYGKLALGNENSPTRPISPYGVTKLAAEHLAQAYSEAYAIPLVTLRYFSVYGPRQRPDMAYHKFFRAILRDEPIEVFGDGHQVRGNTFVLDCVGATIAALDAPVGEVYNVGGGESASVLEVLHKLETITGRTIKTEMKPPRLGDQRQTFADTTKIHNHLKWEPKVSLDVGLAKQWEWQSKWDSELSEPSEVVTPPASPKSRVPVLT
jgi:nucleoside-diphosphate-sugar epimerase